MEKKENKLVNVLRDQSQLIILILLVVVFSITTPSFRTTGNFLNLLKQVTVIGVISCGMTLVVISGCLDLSVGSVFSLLNLASISLQTNNNFLGVIMPLIIAVFIGFFNGFIVTKFKVNSIIVTLGSLALFSGIAQLITNGAIISGVTGTWYGFIGRDKLFGIPVHVYIFFIIAITSQVLLSNTSFGRKIKYVGTNESAAEIAGIKSGRVRTTAFIITALYVAIAALIYSSRMTTASPVAGAGYEFDAITAVVIGGTSLAGGRGSIFKTIVGVLLLALIINVLTLYNVMYSFQNIVKGILIIIAIIVDVRVRRRIEA
jgi:ribose transport system permease protein